MKLITAFTVAMFVAVPAFAQDIASVYANEGAIAADQTVLASAPTHPAAEQQLAATLKFTNASPHSATDTGPYVDDNPLN
ncbi:MAG TPA: hypothetical protein VN809_05505 [Telmatospirillum sp.]|nr:hypothetical protein [Telmatospirillum sp.]